MRFPRHSIPSGKPFDVSELGRGLCFESAAAGLICLRRTQAGCGMANPVGWKIQMDKLEKARNDWRESAGTQG